MFNNKILKIIIMIFYGFYKKGGFQKANALAYTFLMSFVPFFISMASVITLIIPKRLYIHYENKILIDSLPIIGKQIAHYVQSFQLHALDLSIIGVTFLFVTALLMINSLRYHLDQLLGFNDTDLHIGLQLILVIGVFGLLILIGIVLLSINEVILHYLPRYALRKYSFIFHIFQYASSVFAFSLIYKFVPHTKINFKQAFITGSIIAVLFESAKFGFAIYLRTFSTTQNVLYGSLAAIPFFLFWLYIVSIIFLLGAQIISCLWLDNHHE